MILANKGVATCKNTFFSRRHEEDGSYWSGTVNGCSLVGTVAYWAVLSEYFDAGSTLHFTETFTIWPSIGGEIHGRHDGVWNSSTFKFRANGWITDASEEWSHLVGYKSFEMGTTTSLDVLPVYAENTTMRLAPANAPR